MTPFSEILARRRRLDLLRLLSQAPGYSSSEAVLYQALSVGPTPASAAQVGADLLLLAEVGLVELETLVDMQMARITQHGLDVAAGRAQAPGVSRPRPGE
jgi:hypothetical protein